MILLEFSIFPLHKGESVGSYVARAIDIIDRSGLDYRINSMGTVLEGEWDDVFRVVKRCYTELRRDCPRLVLSITVDYRRGRQTRLARKVLSLRKRLRRNLKTDI
ncbi:MAG TPA: MTH1187 family thiamine-binding protein [Elusimicrobiota bacterium]|nr:MTH1187 family thiamine-binding protein [Elusimicrobiota bacterium]